jgi:peroxin-5
MDELARTAGRLVETVDHETSAKFKSSQFLNLMSRIRDKQAGIQGRDIVDTPQGAAASSSVGAQTHTQPLQTQALDKGKARAMDATPATAQQEYALSQSQLPSRLHVNAHRFGQALRGGNALGASAALRSEIEGRQELAEMWAEEDARSEAIEAEARRKAEMAFSGDGGDLRARMAEDDAEAREYAKFAGMRSATGIAGASEHAREWEERMNEEAGDFVGRAWEGTKGKGVRGAQQAEWAQLQDDWEDWQAGPTGLQHAARTAASKLRPASAARAPAYKFQRDNPYVGAATRTHALHSASNLSADLRTVLEREAAVQADPRNAAAWLELGVKQQENEREGLAIAALHKALEIDPTMRDAWLALAVSYTNENDRPAALEATERWIDSLEQYAAVVAAHRASAGGSAAATSAASSTSPLERHIRLIDTLIAIARHGSEAEHVDADIQVALGVLFNASEDYDKAVDCFSAALSVRPDDWLLYNRLGATLSNSGRSNEAIAYYHHALELQPGFARCHFNMSISCLNLKVSPLSSLLPLSPLSCPSLLFSPPG